MTRRSLPVGRIADILPSDRGLTADEARARRQQFGDNDILEAPRRPFLSLVRETLADPMIGFLAGTGLVYWLIGDRAEAITLAVATLPLLGMDAWLHRRTRASTEGLGSRLAARAAILRDGRPADLPARDIVPGDLVIVGAGESVPADGIVVGGEEIQIDESALTGESFPARKRPLRDLPDGTQEAALPAVHLASAGTRLLTGRALVRVVVTGGETVYGGLVRSAAAEGRVRTPLQAAIGTLVAFLVVAAFLFCLVLAAVRLRQGHGWSDAVVSAATLAVASLPEEFPVVFTFFLGVGVFRLARRQALVRRAVSVENIGRITCICSDKTGTITEGRIGLQHLQAVEGLTERRLLSLAAAASRSDNGDPLDRAILDRARESGLPGGADGRLATFPFTEDRRRETALWRDAEGACYAAVKGSAEVVLGMCVLGEEERVLWARRAQEGMEGGHRVIACAARPVPEPAGPPEEPAGGFALAGLLLCEDPVRDGVADAIRRCREAGIRPILVTGDH
ncbi:MAG: HAD-IC family P-type ATPase, partial [Candidatus Polarisedimenticolia bacterium]